jgi:hypothetical protein
MQERRQHPRGTAKSILVSLTDAISDQEITGFLRNVSEGGLKIQKISSKRQVEIGEYNCEFHLSGGVKITAKVRVLGFGAANEKFGEHLIRMCFTGLDKAARQRICEFIAAQEQ